MEQWARGVLGRQHSVQFLCVCVDGKDVAKMFGRLFQMTHAKNVWISRQDQMPNYGQLGCSGFIVIDGQGRCVSRATKALLKVGPEEAFEDAERIIYKALADNENLNGGVRNEGKLEEEHKYAAGRLVRIDNLKSAPELNGAVAKVLSFNTDTGRFIVDLVENSRRLSVAPCSLAPIDAPLAAATPPSPSSKIKQIENPPTVGCEDIDFEHEECTRAINQLLKSTSAGNGAATVGHLRTVLLTLEEHFEHEEELAEQAGLDSGAAVAGSAFSAFESHRKDHERIISIAKDAEARAQTNGYASLEDAQDIAFSFHQHAKQFDVLLEGKLAA